MNARRQILAGILATILAFAGSTATSATEATALDAAQQATLLRYAVDTWHSFVLLVNPRTGLPSDSIGGQLRPASRSAFTSPTNIGMYLWAALAARDLGIISSTEASARLTKTVTSIGRLERNAASGQFYNWYDPATGATLTTWPEPPHNQVYPFLSSVDNGWLAAALIMVANADPALHDAAWSIASSMDFGFYYDPRANPDAGTGLIRGGYWPEVPIGAVATPTNGPTNCIERRRADPNAVPPRPADDPPFAGWTCHHYGAFNTEPRIASYVGIALGQIPADHYFGGWRTFPNTCDWSWQEARPDGAWRDYTVGAKTVHVFEGAYRYHGTKLVPTWGGSMFEALMVPLVVPEKDWGLNSWGVTHPLYVQAQIAYGLADSGYGYWGFSPSSDPAGGYREYGVDAIGMGDGYTTDEARHTLYDAGWADPNCFRPPQAITDYDGGVVTPHASFLALDFDATAALANLAALKSAFPAAYGKGGFKDAINVSTGQVADRYLALDQGMIMAAIANQLTGNQLQGYLAVTLQPALQPLMAMEEFNAGVVGP